MENVAVRVYNIDNGKRSWRLPDGRVIDLPAGAVPEYTDDHRLLTTARVADVKRG